MFLKNILLISIFLFSFNSFATDAKDNEFDKIKNSEAFKKMKNKDDDFHLYLDKKEVEKVSDKYTEINVSYDPKGNKNKKPYFYNLENDEYLKSTKKVKETYYLSGHHFVDEPEKMLNLFNPFPTKKIENKKFQRVLRSKDETIKVNKYTFESLFAYRYSLRNKKIVEKKGKNRYKKSDGSSTHLFNNVKDNFIKAEDLKNINYNKLVEASCSTSRYKILSDKYYIKSVKKHIFTENGEKFIEVKVVDCNDKLNESYAYIHLYKVYLDVTIRAFYSK